MSSATTSPFLPAAKKRYEWIDNSRVIASFLIMYVHLPLALPETNLLTNEVIHEFCVQSTYAGRVTLFLLLSGYLFGRNAPWGKTLDRFFWLLVPYVLWNIIIFAFHQLNQPLESVNWWRVMGIGAIFSSTWVFTSAGACAPMYDFPSWYMRDMLLLTLITPLLVRFKKFLLPALLLFVLFPANDLYMSPSVMLRPSTCFFYLLGVWLTNFKIEDAYRLFNDKASLFFILAFIAACVASVNQTVFHGKIIPITLFGMLIGAMMIAQCGVMVEKHLPKISAKMAPLGPASFLVFMLHVPIFDLVKHVIPNVGTSLWVLILPIPTYVIIVTIFLTMKHYAPWLMPYLGHMKIKKKASA